MESGQRQDPRFKLALVLFESQGSDEAFVARVVAAFFRGMDILPSDRRYNGKCLGETPTRGKLL